MLFLISIQRYIFRCNWATNGTCTPKNVVTILTTRCGTRGSSCSVRANNDWFGDPCPNIPEYLKVVYECRSGEEH